ncbi:MAG: hypothetical protein P8P30_00070 [Rickettsiales bacterium]|nr:hypothetical protein [Rickettsiales bacterium]
MSLAVMSLTDNEKATRRRENKQMRLESLRKRYWQATGEDLPEIATQRGWEVQETEAFQRIILDHVCKCVWYDKLKEPAIMNMSEAQLRKAVYLAQDMVTGARPLEPLNEQSLQWRAERKSGTWKGKR